MHIKCIYTQTFLGEGRLKTVFRGASKDIFLSTNFLICKMDFFKNQVRKCL